MYFFHFEGHYNRERKTQIELAYYTPFILMRFLGSQSNSASALEMYSFGIHGYTIILAITCDFDF